MSSSSSSEDDSERDRSLNGSLHGLTGDKRRMGETPTLDSPGPRRSPRPGVGAHRPLPSRLRPRPTRAQANHQPRPNYSGDDVKASAPASQGLQVATVTATKWAGASKLGSQLVAFLAGIALARLISPSEFGLAAIVIAIGGLAILMSDLGFGAALVHASTITQRKLDTVFWFNAAAGAALTVAIAFAAPFISDLFEYPQLTGLLIVSSFTYSLSLTIVPLAILERRLDLRRPAVVEFGAAVGSATLSIVLALAGAGAYAIVSAPLANVVLLTIGYWSITRYRPRTMGSRAEMASVWQYSRGIVVFNTVNYVAGNIDDILIGKYVSAATTGFYSRAFQMITLPAQQVQFILARTLFPALAKIRDDVALVRDAHRRALVLAVAVCAPVVVAMAATAREFVTFVFGSNWLESVPLLIVLSIASVQLIVQSTVGILYRVVSRNDLMAKWSLVFAVTAVIAFAVGLHWGAIGVCWAIVIRGFVQMPIAMGVPLRLVGDRWLSLMRKLLPVLAALALEGGLGYAACVLGRRVTDSAPVLLLLGLVTCVTTYGLALALLDRSTTRSLIAAIRARGAGVVVEPDLGKRVSLEQSI